MRADVWTVIWREWRQHRAQFDEPRRLLLGIGASAAFLIILELTFSVHRQVMSAHPALLIWIWCWLPLGTAVTLSTDTIAGERERHTLETLLSTRLPDRAILTGKAIAITVHAWMSALALAFGILLTINLVTIWSGALVAYPTSVVLLGPLISFFLTLLGTLAAILFSMGAPTVRQANLRILAVTSVLPVLLIVPVVTLIVLAVVVVAVASESAGFEPTARSFSPGFTLAVVAAITFAAIAAAIALTFVATALRFTRERLMRPLASGGRPDSAGMDGDEIEAGPWLARSTGLAYGTYEHSADPAESEIQILTVLRDARAVVWKELAELRGLAREWRGWLIVIGIVLSTMVLQVSAFVGWFWTRAPDFSLLFWLAMAATLPVLIAQRAADAVAGERERHTGEILFTTRLSDAGILIGKLAVVALLPWSIALAIPLSGLAVTNVIHAASGPYWYPPGVLLAGTLLTLGVAIAFASAGMLVSVGAPTVQHAARRISWFLMPIFIAPALTYRSSLWSTMSDPRHARLPETGLVGMIATGELLRYLLVGLPVLLTLTAILVVALWRRFARGEIEFN